VADYEYRAISLPVGVSSRHARDVIGIHAEFGDWELTRQAIYEGGLRKVTVRRRLRNEPLPPLPS
jgi:hypothetical protein